MRHLDVPPGVHHHRTIASKPPRRQRDFATLPRAPGVRPGEKTDAVSSVPAVYQAGPSRAAAEPTAMAVMPAVTFPGVRVTLPGVPLAAVVPAVPPAPVPGVLAGICVVDPGLAVDRVHGDAPDPPRSPDPPQSNPRPPHHRPGRCCHATRGPRGTRRSWPGGGLPVALPLVITAPAASGPPRGRASSSRHSRTHGTRGSGRDHPGGPQGSVKRSEPAHPYLSHSISVARRPPPRGPGPEF